MGGGVLKNSYFYQYTDKNSSILIKIAVYCYFRKFRKVCEKSIRYHSSPEVFVSAPFRLRKLSKYNKQGFALFQGLVKILCFAGRPRIQINLFEKVQLFFIMLTWKTFHEPWPVHFHPGLPINVDPVRACKPLRNAFPGHHNTKHQYTMFHEMPTF